MKKGTYITLIDFKALGDIEIFSAYHRQINCIGFQTLNFFILFNLAGEVHRISKLSQLCLCFWEKQAMLKLKFRVERKCVKTR